VCGLPIEKAGWGELELEAEGTLCEKEGGGDLEPVAAAALTDSGEPPPASRLSNEELGCGKLELKAASELNIFCG